MGGKPTVFASCWTVRPRSFCSSQSWPLNTQVSTSRPARKSTVRRAVSGEMRCCFRTDRSGPTTTPPLKPALGLSMASAAIKDAMPARRPAADDREGNAGLADRRNSRPGAVGQLLVLGDQCPVNVGNNGGYCWSWEVNRGPCEPRSVALGLSLYFGSGARAPNHNADQGNLLLMTPTANWVWLASWLHSMSVEALQQRKRETHDPGPAGRRGRQGHHQRHEGGPGHGTGRDTGDPRPRATRDRGAARPSLRRHQPGLARSGGHAGPRRRQPRGDRAPRFPVRRRRRGRPRIADDQGPGRRDDARENRGACLGATRI